MKMKVIIIENMECISERLRVLPNNPAPNKQLEVPRATEIKNQTTTEIKEPNLAEK